MDHDANLERYKALREPSYAAGDPCPHCGAPLERRENMFYWRGRYRPGAVCPNSRALYSLAGLEIPPLDPVNPRNDW